jgi:hypothetical protein
MTSNPSPSHDPETGSPLMPQRARASRPVPPLFAGGEQTTSPPPAADPEAAQTPGAPPAGRKGRRGRRSVGSPFGSGSRNAGPRGLLDLEGQPDSSDPGTTGPSKPQPAPGRSLVELREGTRNAVQGASELAHDKLARDEIDRELEVFVADPDDAQHIGDPLAGMINRRLRAAGITTSPDAADLIALVAGVAVYASKQLAKLMEARRRRRQLITPDTPPTDHAAQPGAEPV